MTPCLQGFSVHFVTSATQLHVLVGAGLEFETSHRGTSDPKAGLEGSNTAKLGKHIGELSRSQSYIRTLTIQLGQPLSTAF